MTIEQPSAAWKDYELIDSGDFSKLERWGSYVTIRPEPKALWPKALSDAEWRRVAHTEFKPGAGFGKAGKEDSGTWNMLHKMQEQWTIAYPAVGFNLRLGLTSFKHVGVFPEQAPNWDFIAQSVGDIARKQAQAPKVLNLFAYTGAASLAARKAGAEVTHLDAVRQVVTWARGNMELSGMDGIRWIIEDALKFAKREARRGNKYQGIILDPPAYGHGPDGEKWKLDQCLFDMLKCVGEILEPEHAFMVLNLYSNGYSPLLGETTVREALGGAVPEMESGELALRDRFGKALPLSIYVRVKR